IHLQRDHENARTPREGPNGSPARRNRLGQTQRRNAKSASDRSKLTETKEQVERGIQANNLVTSEFLNRRQQRKQRTGWALRHLVDSLLTLLPSVPFSSSPMWRVF